MLRDIRSDLGNDNAFWQASGEDKTWPGQIVDTAHYESGLLFSFICGEYGDGTYTPLIEESDDSGMSGATVVPESSLIGTIADATMTATVSVGDPLPTIGVTTSKRYVRISIVASAVTDGAVICVITTKMPELKPNEV